MTATAGTRAAKTKKPFPILEGVLPIDMPRVPTEIIAGLTLAALAMPEVMGYAKIAQMPVVLGLYTLVLPMAAFAFFGSSRHLVVGADSATAAVLATGLAGIAAAGAPGSTSWVAMGSLAALMCAVFMIVGRIIRLGFIANFLSHSVLIGFLTGVGIQVAMGQVAGMFGVDAGSGTTLEKFANTLRAIAAGDTSVPTLLVSIAVLVTIVGLERVNKKIPGALIAVVGAIVLSYVFDFAAQGITTVGTVPAGLPPIGLPAITSGELSSDIVALLPIVASMFVLILAQSAATSRAYAMKYDDSFNENVDLIGLGMANAAAGLSGTFVVNGSPTKTEMVDNAGGRSQIAMLATGVVVVVVLLFFTVPLSYMPNAVLSSVVFLIGLKLVDLIGMLGIYGLRKDEFIVAAITAAVVVGVGVEQGIILAIILSLVLVLMHVYKPHNRVLGFGADGQPTISSVGQPVQAAPGLVIYDFGAELFYANATRFTEEIMDIVESADPPLRWLAINAAAIGDIDFSGADSVRQIQNELLGRNATMVLCAVDPAVRRLLDAYGLTDKIGPEHFFDRPIDVVTAYSTLEPGAS
jgi:MFS superfamily sulfate permease-like transporter